MKNVSSSNSLSLKRETTRNFFSGFYTFPYQEDENSTKEQKQFLANFWFATDDENRAVYIYFSMDNTKFSPKVLKNLKETAIKSIHQVIQKWIPSAYNQFWKCLLFKNGNYKFQEINVTFQLSTPEALIFKPHQELPLEITWKLQTAKPFVIISAAKRRIK